MCHAGESSAEPAPTFFPLAQPVGLPTVFKVARLQNIEPFMNTSKLLMTVLMASLLALTSGCFLFVVGAAAGAGAAGYAWVDGEVKTTEGFSMNQTWDASLAAMKDLEFTVTDKSKDALSGFLAAQSADNKTIKINLKYISKTSTEIRIRVGTFGDENLSRIILNKINSHLTSGS
jgi:hypothetical protein